VLFVSLPAAEFEPVHNTGGKLPTECTALQGANGPISHRSRKRQRGEHGQPKARVGGRAHTQGSVADLFTAAGFPAASWPSARAFRSSETSLSHISTFWLYRPLSSPPMLRLSGCFGIAHRGAIFARARTIDVADLDLV
jgi:hypothetical protein